MKNEKMKEEFQEINKNIIKNKNDLIAQNKKIYEINEKLDETECQTEIAKSYLSGFSSIFGFFPKLFSSNKKNNNHTNPRISETQDNKVRETENKNITNDEFDELEKEIYDLNKNAKEIKKEITKSKEGAQKLNEKFTNTNINLDKIKKEAEKIKNNY